MNLINNFIKSIKRVCNNDEMCVMVVFIVIGFMLCYLFKDNISGYVNFATLEDSFPDSPIKLDNKPILPQLSKGIGIELKERKPEPSPSTEKQLQVMNQKPSVSGPAIGSQIPGLLSQDSMMFKPFDEIWNPGFMPLDMVFKDVKIPLPGLGQPGPPGPQRSLKPQQPMGGATGGDLKVILHYAPWCGHSKKMLPDYERVKSEFDGQVVNGKKVSIIMYNSDVDKDKVKEYGVKGFPTLFVEKNGAREPFPHRSYDKIAEYIKSA
tara:strand:- start:1971 stop:2765 length:795 start_codon:yes stop_codon:yes gene_type:complete